MVCMPKACASTILALPMSLMPSLTSSEGVDLRIGVMRLERGRSRSTISVMSLRVPKQLAVSLGLLMPVGPLPEIAMDVAS